MLLSGASVKRMAALGGGFPLVVLPWKCLSDVVFASPKYEERLHSHQDRQHGGHHG